ncbi:type VI secretion system protein TssA [Pantoea agglomerans]|uniref:type VI secretion system protein TssA n=1 Tax=Enterobacter agglomerans TaxID=549 RepID=UPI00301D22BD
MNIDNFLKPLSDDNPCGDNLEYDTSFLTLEEEIKGKSEQQFGDTIIPAIEPDWVRVEKLSQEIFSRTKDLRVAIYLTMSWTNLKGFTGYLNGLQLITKLLEQYWDNIHPKIEDDEDILMRNNIISSLGDGFSLFQYVKRIKIVSSYTESLDFKDVCAVLDGSSNRNHDYFRSKESVRTALIEQCENIKDEINLILECLKKINSIISEKIGEGALPEISQLSRMLAILNDAFLSGNGTHASNNKESTIDSTDVYTEKKRGIENNTTLSTKDDVKNHLKQIINYFENHEPSHPASLMIERILFIIDMDFISIISELMPDETEKVKAIFGKVDHNIS